ncbi:MAG: hypothetical protein N2Z22_10595 [Turneriella sp.]|nr:hypothetical protein [Leptospiraceae bacterium]MCX7633767.1 hypothetical protein [Turneriella sp.]
MATLQSFVSPENWYSLQYPRTWEMEVIEGIPTFFDGISPYGGALQFFAANLTGQANEAMLRESPFLAGNSLQEKMELFLSQQGVSPVGIHSLERDQTLMKVCEYRSGGHFFLALMAERGSIFVLALYNCKGEPDEAEAMTVGKILQSLTLL